MTDTNTVADHSEETSFDWMFSEHIPAQTMIGYRNGLLSGDKQDLLQSHLLVCPICQMQLTRVTARGFPIPCQPGTISNLVR